jgi:hypothetical protein
MWHSLISLANRTIRLRFFRRRYLIGPGYLYLGSRRTPSRSCAATSTSTTASAPRRRPELPVSYQNSHRCTTVLMYACSRLLLPAPPEPKARSQSGIRMQSSPSESDVGPSEQNAGSDGCRQANLAGHTNTATRPPSSSSPPAGSSSPSPSTSAPVHSTRGVQSVIVIVPSLLPASSISFCAPLHTVPGCDVAPAFSKFVYETCAFHRCTDPVTSFCSPLRLYLTSKL